MSLLVKNITRCFSSLQVLCIAMSLVICFGIGIGALAYMEKSVVIDYNGRKLQVVTNKSTVKEVLRQQSIKITPDDYINLSLEHKLQKTSCNYICIKQAVPINIVNRDKQFRVNTYKVCVSDAVRDNLSLFEGINSIINCNNDSKIEPDMQIRVGTKLEKIVTLSEPIPFKAIYKENNNLYRGTHKVIQEGKEGICEKIFKVILQDGAEVAREFVKNSIVIANVDSIIEYGTLCEHITSRGDVIRSDKVLDMDATAYTLSFRETGKCPGQVGFGITKLGIPVRQGVISVDPRVIPLGTKVYVQGLYGNSDYGYAIAADTGSAIKGNIIDVFFQNLDHAVQWGRKKVKVHVGIH